MTQKSWFLYFLVHMAAENTDRHRRRRRWGRSSITDWRRSTASCGMDVPKYVTREKSILTRFIAVARRTFVSMARVDNYSELAAAETKEETPKNDWKIDAIRVDIVATKDARKR